MKFAIGVSMGVTGGLVCSFIVLKGKRTATYRFALALGEAAMVVGGVLALTPSFGF